MCLLVVGCVGRATAFHGLLLQDPISPWGRADSDAQPPAGTKGEEASARGPVPAFRAHGSKEVGEESWLDTGLDSVPFEHSSRDDSSASPCPDLKHVPVLSCELLHLSPTRLLYSCSLHHRPQPPGYACFPPCDHLIRLLGYAEGAKGRALRRAPSM